MDIILNTFSPYEPDLSRLASLSSKGASQKTIESKISAFASLHKISIDTAYKYVSVKALFDCECAESVRRANQFKGEHLKAEKASIDQNEQPKSEQRIAEEYNIQFVAKGLQAISANLPLLYKNSTARKNFLGKIFANYKNSNRSTQVKRLQETLDLAAKALQLGTKTPEEVFSNIQKSINEIKKDFSSETRLLGDSKLEDIINKLEKGELKAMQGLLSSSTEKLSNDVHKRPSEHNQM